MKALQLKDWYDLRHHILEITKEYILFKFSLDNAPDFNQGALQQLKEQFGEIQVDTPVEEKPWTGPIVEYQHTGDMFVKLTFKTGEKMEELIQLLG